MKSKRGFTIIEVMLFLAVAALMFVGVIANTHNNIASQRFSSSVQNFASFLRRVYNEVEDVQIASRSATTTVRDYCTMDAAMIASRNLGASGLSGSGRSDCAVYGKLVTFGEDQTNSKAIHVYDVIGNIVDNRHPISATDDLSAVAEVQAGVVMLSRANAASPYSLSASSYSVTLDWDAWIEDTTGSRFTGALLIVRSPLSGVVHTYLNNTYSANGINLSRTLSSAGTAASGSVAGNLFGANGSVARLTNGITSGGYSAQEVNFCVDSDDRGGQRRRNIRLVSDARNSGDIIVVVADDATENRCYNN